MSQAGDGLLGNDGDPLFSPFCSPRVRSTARSCLSSASRDTTRSLRRPLHYGWHSLAPFSASRTLHSSSRRTEGGSVHLALKGFPPAESFHRSSAFRTEQGSGKQAGSVHTAFLSIRKRNRRSRTASQARASDPLVARPCPTAAHTPNAFREDNPASVRETLWTTGSSLG